MKITKSIAADLYLASGKVRHGPFRGTFLTSYPGASVRNKWLGSYEKELHSVWDRILAARPRTIFDIGGAEGLYACGLLRLLPEANLYVWETLERERDLIRRNTARNAVANRCVIHGTCDISTLKTAITRLSPDLLICDIEGAERELLTPGILDDLRSSTLVVETHGLEVFEGLLRFVSTTHDVEVIHPRPRTSADWTLPWWIYATNHFKHWAVQERRTIPTPWIIGWPRAKAA